MRLRTRSAQSIIEYSIIAGIVILAVIYGGPFLVRSINARFMMMDNNTQDSFLENFKDAGVPDNAPDCRCTPSDNNAASWPAGECGLGGCSPTERNHVRTCKPLRCQKESACVSDDTCCFDPIPVYCGKAVDLHDTGTSLQANSFPNDVMSGLSEHCFGRENLQTSGFKQEVYHFLVTKFGAANVRGRCLDQAGDLVADQERWCAIGEKLYRNSCGVTGSNPPTTKDWYSCIVQPQDCNPSCRPMHSSDLGNNAAACPPPGSSERYDPEDRDMLKFEVDMRLNGGTYLHGVDSPLRGLGSMTRAESRYGENAYKVYYTYVKEGQCNATKDDRGNGPVDRGCERYCTNGLKPNSDATACTCKTEQECGPAYLLDEGGNRIPDGAGGFMTAGTCGACLTTSKCMEDFSNPKFGKCIPYECNDDPGSAVFYWYDAFMDDYGTHAHGDSLVYWCIDHKRRFCLTGKWGCLFGYDSNYNWGTDTCMTGDIAPERDGMVWTAASKLSGTSVTCKKVGSGYKVYFSDEPPEDTCIINCAGKCKGISDGCTGTCTFADDPTPRNSEGCAGTDVCKDGYCEAASGCSIKGVKLCNDSVDAGGKPCVCGPMELCQVMNGNSNDYCIANPCYDTDGKKFCGDPAKTTLTNVMCACDPATEACNPAAKRCVSCLNASSKKVCGLVAPDPQSICTCNLATEKCDGASKTCVAK